MATAPAPAVFRPPLQIVDSPAFSSLSMHVLAREARSLRGPASEARSRLDLPLLAKNYRLLQARQHRSGQIHLHLFEPQDRNRGGKGASPRVSRRTKDGKGGLSRAKVLHSSVCLERTRVSLAKDKKTGGRQVSQLDTWVGSTQPTLPARA